MNELNKEERTYESVFMKNIKVCDNGCWEIANTTGFVQISGKRKTFQHIAYFIKFGTWIAKGRQRINTCMNSKCVNPEHTLENSLRAHLNRRTRICDNGCIEYTGTLTRDGYGQFWHDGHWLAHRAAWVLEHGDIPKSLEIMHSCDNRRCINIEHISLGTHIENMQDCKQKGRNNISGAGFGNKNGRRLTKDQASDIKTSSDKVIELAKRYDVCATSIRNIKTGKTWKNV